MKADLLMSIEGLSASFQDEDARLQALKDVSFDIPKSKTVCLVGESGCGKSVTARAILRILGKNAEIDAGKVLYKQADDTQLDIAALPATSSELQQLRGNDVTMIFQEPMTAISSFYTIGNQITEALRQHEALSKRSRSKTSD